MKKFIFILVVVLLGLGLYIWQDPQLKRKVLHQAEDVITPSTTTVYKWKDKNGNPVISNSPPTGDTPYETLKYHRDSNVVPTKEEKKSQK